MTTPLPCGCVRGAYLCPVAEQLWRRCNGAWYEGNDDESQRLRELYEAHFYPMTTAHASDGPAFEAQP